MSATAIEDLAEADEHEVVQQVQVFGEPGLPLSAIILTFLLLQEFYADFYALNPGLFSLNVDSYIGYLNHMSLKNSRTH